MNSPELLCYYNPALIPADERTLDVDLCVYGGNAAGCTTAIQARKMGLSVALLEPSGHVGGLTAGGLSRTDHGRKYVIGGLSREFYRRCGAHYGVEEEWYFEPKVAERVLLTWLEEVGVRPLFRRFLSKVHKENNRITSIELEGGLKVRAKVFVDCSHEGDLMAMAGVSYHVGREDNTVYGETLNGAHVREYHQFDRVVSPYIVENDASSGLLPGIETSEYVQGAGDARVQAYNFRLCLSKDPNNQKPFEKPAGYDEREYELLARYIRGAWENYMRKYDEIRGDKCDMNNYGALSSDFIGRNFDYPEGDYATRERIFQEHVTFQKGLMWFRTNDPRVPADMREGWSQWLLTRDEFPDCGGWPHQLYIRESRRMVSDYIVTEADCRGDRECDDPVGMGSYTLDSHNCRRFVSYENGVTRVLNEGDVQVPTPPYKISRRSITPRKSECENLLVVYCAAASHIAYGSLRMEPVFMLLGQSAATIAALAILAGSTPGAVQDVPYNELRPILERDGQVLEVPEEHRSA
jgi:hypothetical protein